mmetsp:Transcript_24253/g.34713  ORF Transcript_24253/g.34713 Transcript_24253/m.34713 type:complete len:242 (+) Transcript_24253:173-898(+)
MKPSQKRKKPRTQHLRRSLNLKKNQNLKTTLCPMKSTSKRKSALNQVLLHQKRKDRFQMTLLTSLPKWSCRRISWSWVAPNRRKSATKQRTKINQSRSDSALHLLVPTRAKGVIDETDGVVDAAEEEVAVVVNEMAVDAVVANEMAADVVVVVDAVTEMVLAEEEEAVVVDVGDAITKTSTQVTPTHSHLCRCQNAFRERYLGATDVSLIFGRSTAGLGYLYRNNPMTLRYRLNVSKKKTR